MPNSLNPLQQAALEYEGNALVLACPGSGKTRVLTLKIARELEQLSKRTDRIAALTFTNRAADEIDKRISDMGIDSSKLWTGTIHSFCLQWIIKPYGIYLPELEKGFSILDEFKAEIFKRELKEKYGIPMYQNFITRRDREGNYFNDSERLNNIAKEYHEIILENKMIDFDLILYFSYVLLEIYPKISVNISKIFKYFFIDEFQDTQDLQYAIVGEIFKAAEGTCKIFLVGDPDQAIFKSLGGIVKTVSEISEEIGGYAIKELRLSGNYRSTQRMIDFYRNFQSIDLKIESMAEYCGEKGIITFDKCTHKNNLVEKIAEIIQEKIKSGIPPHEICVLAPQWTFLTSIVRKLKSHLPDIPLDAPGLTVLPRDRDNFWYKLTRIILSPRDPNRFLIRMKWAKEILEELIALDVMSINLDSDRCRKFLKIVNSLDVKNQDAIGFLGEAFKQVFVRLEIDYSLNKLLIEQWDSFFSGIKRRYEKSDFKDIPKDITYIKKMFNSRDGIVVNTCQGIKGEEFHTVIAFGLLRGYIPHWSAIYNQVEEEANKLLYVIASRAKENLFLFAERGRLNKRSSPYEINRQLKGVRFNYNNSNNI
ncbi:ATP-dependent helicase [Bacillus cereus group sp. TH204-1LC]|uniref:UvrD-helicase domain-containing protein n=1 Tax=unclassified Bacillus cereus group TaxID=2750818 RepID=UPI0022E37237|nr:MULTISPECIES: ATP-dependent helicase [unclassified Bacillus cereus group]MDA1617288.1 ATP-dependent helicase [Bacillus cereus group sp. TH204-1LC]MDX5882015.1 ATP-dependent helicase [Bacillus cereus group sp. BfR-BA-00999]